MGRSMDSARAEVNQGSGRAMMTLLENVPEVESQKTLIDPIKVH